MNHTRALSTLIVMACTVAGSAMLYGQTQTDQPAKADNTKVNARDNADTSPTAEQQKENDSDREITRRIRQSVVGDESLSTSAHNVKIITRDGHVTLKGPVRSNDEKRKIEAKAVEVAGENKVTNELDIKQ
jgi:hyperosmotically inducible periplasmic protein